MGGESDEERGKERQRDRQKASERMRDAAVVFKTLAAFFLPSPTLNAHFMLRIESLLGSPACHLSVLFVKLILPLSPTLLVIPV